MMRCRDGVTDLSGKSSHGRGGTRLLPPHEDRAIVERCSRMSAHDAWVYAQRDGGQKAAFMWREAGLKSALEGRIGDARQWIKTALRMMDGAGELETRKYLHAHLMRGARNPRDGTRALANELVELAAEIIEPVDREASFRLRNEVIRQHREMQHFEDATYNSIHMAVVLKREDPARAEEYMRAAITDLREAAADYKRFHKEAFDLEAELGKAMHTLAELLERRGAPEAEAAYEEAGDHFFAGRKSTGESGEEMLRWARMSYESAKGLGGDAAILDGKIAACVPPRMGCVVLTPEEGALFMDMVGAAERSGEFVEIASTDDD